MKLKNLFENISVEFYRGSKEIEIKGICIHSKKATPGDLFISLSDDLDQSLTSIHEAIQSGCTAILASHGNPFLKNVGQLIHPNPKQIIGKLCAIFYQYQSNNLFKIGITGTSGKTTVAYLVRHLFEELQLPCGLIGTVEYIVGSSIYPAERTTPDVLTNHRLLREMSKKNLVAAVMEISSHGLIQRRVDEIDFDVGIYTNLSPEHLDYHQSMEEYARAKSLLFKILSPHATAVVWEDCPWKQTILKDCKSSILSYGFTQNSDLFIKDFTLRPTKTLFTLRYKSHDYFLETTLAGKHNILNCVAAVGSLLCYGKSLEELILPLKSFQGAPGRLQRVNNSNIFIDYAHKPDALEKVLLALMPLKKGKIITVFGCGGDRDRAKRPLMAQIAEKFSDQVIVTSDNPRSENPSAIIHEIIQGFKGSNYTIIEDRHEAIYKAIVQSKKEDLILIAGKGHEAYQIFSNRTIAFDDKKVAEQCLVDLQKQN